MGEDKPSPCEQDDTQCPTSARLSTDVACDCRCVAGYEGITPTRAFEGPISACLPAELNANTASVDQRVALGNLSGAQFNQRVFKYCSEDVAGFLSELIEEQQRPNELAAVCMGPRIKCECTTTGARAQTAVCSSPCADKECDRDNCMPLLKVGGAVDSSGCSCSRVNACGKVTPASAEPPICLNRLAAVLRRQSKRRRQPPTTPTGGRWRQRVSRV